MPELSPTLTKARKWPASATFILLLLIVGGAPAFANPVPGPPIHFPMRLHEQRIYAMVPQPHYPDSAVASHTTGKVVVSVRADSLRDSVWVSFRSGSALLDNAASAAARKVAWHSYQGMFDITFNFIIAKAQGAGDTAIAYVANVTHWEETWGRVQPPLVEAVETTAVVGASPALRAIVPVPAYPEMVLFAGIEGKPTVNVMVSRGGKIDSARVTKSSGNQMIDASTISCARQMTFFGPGVRRLKTPATCEVSYSFLLTRSQAKNPYYEVPMFATVKVAGIRLVK